MIFTPELFAQSLIAGVIIGVIYALMALGVTFIYSIVKMVNWAMGEFYMLGSFAQYFLVVSFLGPDLWYVAAVLSAASVFLVGWLIEPVLIKPMFTGSRAIPDDHPAPALSGHLPAVIIIAIAAAFVVWLVKFYPR